MTAEVQYTNNNDDHIRCNVCPHMCRIKPGSTGICTVRENKGGTLVATNYGQLASYAVDPTEKKPLYHFWPGSELLSVGSVGCNFKCGFCQNWQISQEKAPTVTITPEQVVTMAESERLKDKCIGIAFTYSEPLMWYEFVLDTAQLAQQRDIKTVLVTNGYINPEPRAQLFDYIDAVNIDVKSMTDDFYKSHCQARPEPVLDTVQYAYDAGCHVEVTNLIITHINDSDDHIDALTKWLAGIDPGIPLHLSRYVPGYKFTQPPTPVETIIRACRRARNYLHHVYAGNITTDSDTRCTQCNNVLIKRAGFAIRCTGIGERDNYQCQRCGHSVPITGKIVAGRW